MSKPYTILHISDLHRSPDDNITNEELISALLTDLDRYQIENPSISYPDAIIVSGDVIQGVPLKHLDFKKSLEEQYNTAHCFLDELTKRILNGDRSKVIIIPGNHDVDWNTAFGAMLEIKDSELPTDFASQLSQEDSVYRWNWKTRTAYKIIDKELYAKRLACFWDFFEKFYRDVPGLFRVTKGADANLFLLNEKKIGIAAFNSCHGNDCFAFHGYIKKDAIGRAYLDFRDAKFSGLLISVWHHNLDGPPYRSDYMDVDIVRGMIGRGFRLGLYGHQHKPQVAPFKILLPENETMALISAGSLCAGKRELPPGYNRQYNILEISEDLTSVRVHAREMIVANLFSTGKFRDLGGASFVDLNWELPRNNVGGLINIHQEELKKSINAAEEAFKNNRFEEVVNILSKVDLSPNTYQRKLFISALEKAADWVNLVTMIDPKTIDELESVINAYERQRDFDGALLTLDKFCHNLGLEKYLEDQFQKRIEVNKKISQNV